MAIDTEDLIDEQEEEVESEDGKKEEDQFNSKLVFSISTVSTNILKTTLTVTDLNSFSLLLALATQF